MKTIHLTEEQKGQALGILSVGCDRQTVADFLGCSVVEINRAMRADRSFAQSVHRTEAGAELAYMRTVQNAARDEKNWRASVWWLERRSPERFGPRSAGALTAKQLKAFNAALVDVLIDEVGDAINRERIIMRLETIVDALTQDSYQQTAEPPKPDSKPIQVLQITEMRDNATDDFQESE